MSFWEETPIFQIDIIKFNSMRSVLTLIVIYSLNLSNPTHKHPAAFSTFSILRPRKKSLHRGYDLHCYPELHGCLAANSSRDTRRRPSSTNLSYISLNGRL